MSRKRLTRLSPIPNISTRAWRNISKLCHERAQSNATLEVIPGFQAPKREGKSYYFTNKRGDIIRHPSAYRAKYGKPIYHASTRVVTVGFGWLVENNLV